MLKLVLLAQSKAVRDESTLVEWLAGRKLLEVVAHDPVALEKWAQDPVSGEWADAANQLGGPGLAFRETTLPLAVVEAELVQYFAVMDLLLGEEELEFEQVAEPGDLGPEGIQSVVALQLTRMENRQLHDRRVDEEVDDGVAVVGSGELLARADQVDGFRPTVEARDDVVLHQSIQAEPNANIVVELETLPGRGKILLLDIEQEVAEAPPSLRHGQCALARAEQRKGDEKFPRYTPLGYLLVLSATTWFVYYASLESVADFVTFKPILYILFIGVGIGTCLFVRDFLPIRGLAVLLLLLAKMMVDTARWVDSEWRLVIVTWAYLWVVAGMWFTISPWRLRDIINWATANPQRTRLLSGCRLAFGLFVVLLGLTAFRAAEARAQDQSSLPTPAPAWHQPAG